ncbi:YhcH/YjgK/YiaL family protein [Hufsiella ginkgonis]|uniref:DUF386 family protein n=1 Tax=Hufsiella ginkgonis TaxID=2695274 RepID=A0A7K1XTJ4_9SPHI|nr:YhcH/YjgK/YiaL family protein [Hufsiella ginkgonis]MXV13836.1 DUF386 family protein [Hufsiella ginkgonis]
MRSSLLRNTLFLLIAVFFTACAASRNTSGVSDDAVEKWFNAREWAGGLSLNVYGDVNKREFYRQYHKNKEWWDKSFAYLKTHDLPTHPNGKTLIAGDSVYVSVTEAPGKDFDKTGWESHRKFIDLQYVAAGKEQIVVSDISKLKVTQPYSDARDVANYSGEGKSYIAEPGTYYLFFPADGHRPSIKVNGNENVKKVVIKIRYTYF